MTGTARTARRTPTRPDPDGTRATDPDRTAPPGTAPARAAAHPVPKSFRSKERPS
jgi:hypothetical protein